MVLNLRFLQITIAYIIYFLKKDLNMRRRTWMEFLEECKCLINYHPENANVVTDVLSRRYFVKFQNSLPSKLEDVVMKPTTSRFPKH